MTSKELTITKRTPEEDELERAGISIEQKVADFLTLMIQVAKYEKDGEYKDECDGKEACPRCSSSICMMIQRNNNLKCWLSYADRDTGNPIEILSDFKNKE
jgi:hypothetical protein